MVNIRKATPDDIESVISLFKELIDEIKNHEYTPEWEYGIYPTDDDIIKPIESGELYVGEIESEIVSTIVIDHKPNEGYNNIKWNINTTDENIFYVHLVAVKQSYCNKGIAKEMLNYVFDKAKKQSIKSIRLNVVKNNLPAENLYKKLSFEYIDSIEIFIKNRGLKFFKVFEKIIR